MVEAIVTRLDDSKEYNFQALSSMKKLRLFSIDGLHDIYCGPNGSHGPDGSDGSDNGNWDGPEFSYSLQYLEWTGFPYTKLPSSFKPRNLVQLKLWRSKLRRLWNNGIKVNFLCQFIEHCL